MSDSKTNNKYSKATREETLKWLTNRTSLTPAESEPDDNPLAEFSSKGAKTVAPLNEAKDIISDPKEEKHLEGNKRQERDSDVDMWDKFISLLSSQEGADNASQNRCSIDSDILDFIDQLEFSFKVTKKRFINSALRVFMSEHQRDLKKVFKKKKNFNFL